MFSSNIPRSFGSPTFRIIHLPGSHVPSSPGTRQPPSSPLSWHRLNEADTCLSWKREAVPDECRSWLVRAIYFNLQRLTRDAVTSAIVPRKAPSLPDARIVAGPNRGPRVGLASRCQGEKGKEEGVRGGAWWGDGLRGLELDPPQEECLLAAGSADIRFPERLRLSISLPLFLSALLCRARPSSTALLLPLGPHPFPVLKPLPPSANGSHDSLAGASPHECRVRVDASHNTSDQTIDFLLHTPVSTTRLIVARPCEQRQGNEASAMAMLVLATAEGKASQTRPAEKCKSSEPWGFAAIFVPANTGGPPVSTPLRGPVIQRSKIDVVRERQPKQRELPAIKYFVTYFRQYLYGKTSAIETGHTSLRFLEAMTEHNIRIQVMAIALAEYDFQADATSRLPTTGKAETAIIQINNNKY
ncbi:hypothetical protein PR048_021234 [Dryococelus australis]|uniref:Reverse transcriptase RNase H-like domain-containing protein n=1 Tax=Dryococelus australis TaxID=614101 RepID=A0ABQ9GXQ4_9NEOP|nr:hypothetical protein PR048_021234 [Dryococelus australis]